MSSIQEAHLRTTPFSHAFRPRLSHAFQPRLSATLSGHVFRRAILVEDIVCTPKRPKTFRSRISLIIEASEAQVLGNMQLHFADANFLPFLVQGLSR